MAEERTMRFPTGVANVVGGWLLDENSGTTAADWSGNSYDFTYGAGGAAPTQFLTADRNNGQIEWNWGYGLDFDGTADYAVRTGLAANLETQVLTVEALFRLDALPGVINTLIIYKPKGAFALGRGWYFGVNGSGGMFLRLGNGGGAYQLLNGTNSTVLPGEWLYAAATFSTPTWIIYLRGVQDTTKTQALTISYADDPVYPADTKQTLIGAAQDTLGVKTFFTDGQIADVRVSNVVRTAAEIAAMQENLFPTAQSTGGFTIPSDFGAPGLPFSSYMRYKSTRKAVEVYNNLSLAP